MTPKILLQNANENSMSVIVADCMQCRSPKDAASMIISYLPCDRNFKDLCPLT